MTNLLDFNRTQLKAWVNQSGERDFRADQLFKWIHQDGMTDFDLMTNLSKSFRERLKQIATVKPLNVVLDHLSQDGTRKWLLELPDQNRIETVYIPEKNRGTLCVSSQVGCGLNCQFCATATQGFNRNLSTAEIICQIWHAVHSLKAEPIPRKVTNVVFMGMGEPLLNFDHVLSAMDIMMDDFGYGLSKYRVTLSTSGLIPQMEHLSKVSDCALAVSLHAPNNALRNELVPLNKKYPIESLMAVCKNYFPKNSKRKITFEYVMLDGVNDKPEHAKQLAQLLRDIPSKINLIPFNPFPLARYKRSSDVAIEQFRHILVKAGYITITRKTRGDDIAAACGQLVGDFNDRTSRSARYLKQAEQRIEQGGVQ